MVPLAPPFTSEPSPASPPRSLPSRPLGLLLGRSLSSLRPGLTLVVSPLIALMKDQLDGLLANGVRAAMLSSVASSASDGTGCTRKRD